MMTPLAWLGLSLALYLAGALCSLLFCRQEALAIRLSGCCALAAGCAGLLAAAPVLLQGGAINVVFAGPFDAFAHLTLRIDSLAAFMTLVISLLAALCALYSLAYLEEYRGRGAWAMGFFMNLFIASMVALVVVDNAFYFIVLFEVMSLSSYFLVIADQDEEAVSAGLLYFLIAHAGSVLIMIAFFLLYRHSNSLDFADFRQASLSAPQASIVFLLAFFGFGAKAGMLPLHGWLPRAHPAAPSHASALMSGVMVKIGVFGIIKVGIDLLGATEAWWGVVVLAFGAVSSVLGVLYALAEHDIKRLLAYHTVENIGIILMGVGTGMIGIATHHPLLALLGLLGGLYHLINHAVFKGLLFLGAGAVISRVHTKDMEKMGGLARLMPRTALAFLMGCMAISALPPLNGFVSEWFTYQSLFTLSHDGHIGMKLLAPVAIVMLAITGALAAMCFVKVYGISFCGAPRSEKASHAAEVPWPMTAAMLLLALLCVLLGVGASVVSPVITRIAADLAHTPALTVAAGLGVFPGDAGQTRLNTPLIFILLLALPLLPLMLYSLLRGPRLAFRQKGTPWACGYGYEQAMSASAGSFTQPLRVMFAPLYRLRKTLDPAPSMQRALESTTRTAAQVEPVLDERIVLPLARAVQGLGRVVQGIQHGDFRVYCLYVVAALVALLLTTLV
ncbi:MULTISPECIES: hydrogenase 4 subunit B [Dickeya]|uniref:Hydrogenase-4 component B / Formate hydrogenlyase subunit 3 n=1 Tax=Dickeya aquatica TaxID=1401087 RepID=A0A375A8Q2_9GAMM|nr:MULTISPECIES: hydrogenase 4 subunit B [Dickeya]SLM62468.1 Hydrogenase-4 component B / Formate hydrogenlyase subunit 3 [Dickeya aquatica]